MKRFILFLGLVLLVIAPTGAAKSGGARPFDEMIVFGASMVDTGNAHIMSEGAVAASPYWGGRLSNGPVWVERLAQRLRLGNPKENRPVPAPSFAGGTNYAVGGAQTGEGTAPSGSPNVGLQLDFFFQDEHDLDGDELIVIAAGGNDRAATYAARNLADHIAELADAGGKHFLVSNAARYSQFPGISDDPWADEFVSTFNEELDDELDALEASRDIEIYRLDLTALHDDMIESPSSYGFSNVDDPACPGCGGGIPEEDAENTLVSNPDEYMFWDFFHFSATAHEIIGKAAANAVNG
jgi:phospholipase/lecithinase/hemolysin